MITGYDIYCNLQGRGSVLYVKASLQSLQVKMQTEFDVSVWCFVKLHNNNSLLVGSVCRSPNAPDSDNEKFMLMINEVLQTKHSHLLIMGNFNFPEIDWELQTANVSENHAANKFVSCFKDFDFVPTYATQLTHYRAIQQRNILDLLVTNEPGMIDNLKYREPVGNSHHCVLDWTFRCCGTQQLKKHITKIYFDSGDYSGMKMCFAQYNSCEIFEELSVDETWTVISDIIRAACVKYIPHKTLSVTNHHHRKPAWKNERVFTEMKKKKEAFSRYKDTRDGQHYLECVKARNAAIHYEKEIAKRAKKNPKAFYKYVNGKIKTKDSVGVLDNENRKAVTDKEIADLLNNFSAVYILLRTGIP